MLASALVGCGSGDDGDVGEEVAFADFQQRLVAAYCKRLVACASMPDEATCLTAIQLQVGYVATLQQDIDSGKTRFDGRRAGQCLAFIEGLRGCKKTETSVEAAELLEVGCPGLFAGTVIAGGACFFHEECASGLCMRADAACSISRQCCAGTCVEVPPPVPAGGDCSSLLANQTCAAGSVCLSPELDQPLQCLTPPTSEGAPCLAMVGCRWPLSCDVEGNVRAGTCKRPAATGEICNPQGSRPCDDGRDVCAQETTRCTPKVSVGTPCTSQTCVGWAECRNAACEAKLTPGESCDPTFGSTCLGGASCINLICTITPADDACI